MSELSGRQNFPIKIIKLLRDRAGDVCSKPDCRVHTAGAGSQADKTVSIGVAAHMHAASPGGPRYKTEMSDTERRSYDNGIWLCQSCSRLIDMDELRFPVDVLRGWKRHAESYSVSRVGQKAITQREHDSEVQRAYGKGIAAQPNDSGFSIDSICKVLEGFESGLSELDERFMHSVEHLSASKVVHRIEPKPGCEPSVNLLVRDSNKTRAQFKRFQEYGESITLDGNSFKFEGSKLFETLINGRRASGRLTMGAARQKIETYLFFRSELFGDCDLACFDSYMTCGSKGLAIEGKGLAGLFSVNATIAQEFGAKVNVNFSVEAWKGLRLNKLSYFPKLLKALDFLAKDSEARLVIEFYYDSSPLLLDSLRHQYKGFIQGFTEIITTVNYCRNIAANFSESLVFKEYDVSDDDYEKMKFYCQILAGPYPMLVEEGYQYFEGNFAEGMETSTDYWQPLGSGKLTYKEQPNGRVTNVLGNRVVAPLVHIVISGYSVSSFCRVDSKDSKQVSFTVTATKGSTYEWSFDSNGRWLVQ